METNISILFSLLILLNINLFAQDQNLGRKGLAIQGYDPVSYFEDGPEKGDPSISSEYNDAVYYFASESHKKQFDADPEKFVPSYGGYCAYAVAVDGSKVKINPETYRIQDGELLLFYNFRKNNTLVPWEKDAENFKKKADKNWNNTTK